MQSRWSYGKDTCTVGVSEAPKLTGRLLWGHLGAFETDVPRDRTLLEVLIGEHQ